MITDFISVANAPLTRRPQRGIAGGGRRAAACWKIYGYDRGQLNGDPIPHLAPFRSAYANQLTVLNLTGGQRKKSHCKKQYG